MKREVEWPRYMKRKRLADGGFAYYWTAHKRDYEAGFLVEPEALGRVFDTAASRARFLNDHLDAWREGRGEPTGTKNPARIGTIDWWIALFLVHEACTRNTERTQEDYRDTLYALADLPTKLTDEQTTPMRVGELPTTSLSQAAVDKLYKMLQKDGTVTRQANYSIDVARRAWNIVKRDHPTHFLVPTISPDGKLMHLPINPFQDVLRVRYERETAIPATREQALKFADAAEKAGRIEIGIAALICFEWHQRPEDVRGGRITWSSYRPADHPTKVQIFHRKTHKRVWKTLERIKPRRKLYPELETRLARLPQLGVPMIMFVPQKGPKGQDGKRIPRIYSEPHMQHEVQRIRRIAELPDYFTLEACRHGGLTELGDAELTEQQIMASSAHVTPSAARIYVKKTEKQEQSAAEKRRDFVDRRKRTKTG